MTFLATIFNQMNFFGLDFHLCSVNFHGNQAIQENMLYKILFYAE